MIELKHSDQAPTAFGIGGVAKTVGLATIFGVAAAHGLATVAERGLLPHFTVEWRKPDAVAANRTTTQVATIIRSIGVDGVTTSTITTMKPARVEARSLSPCGEPSAGAAN